MFFILLTSHSFEEDHYKYLITEDGGIYLTLEEVNAYGVCHYHLNLFMGHNLMT